MADELKLGPLGQVAMTVDDLDAAIDFYGGKLGLKLLGQAPPGLAFFNCDGVRLMLSSVSEDGPTGNSVLYFRVLDIESAFESLTSNGVEFISEPNVIHSKGEYELRMAFFKDPAGNTMAIMGERGDMDL